MNPMGIGFGAVESLPKSNIDKNVESANMGANASFIVFPTSLGRGAVGYKTGFPEDWRSHTFW